MRVPAGASMAPSPRRWQSDEYCPKTRASTRPMNGRSGSCGFKRARGMPLNVRAAAVEKMENGSKLRDVVFDYASAVKP